MDSFCPRELGRELGFKVWRLELFGLDMSVFHMFSAADDLILHASCCWVPFGTLICRDFDNSCHYYCSFGDLRLFKDRCAWFRCWCSLALDPRGPKASLLLFVAFGSEAQRA